MFPTEPQPYRRREDRTDEDIVRHLDEGLAEALEVQAVQLVSTNVQELADWAGGQVIEESNPFDPDQKFVAINVPTPTGMKRASHGYFLVHHWNDWYVCPPDRFNSLFELVID